jgi:hypothetical protein
MTLISSYGREAGYPTCDETLNGGRVTRTYTDRYKVLLNDGYENTLGEDIFAALPSDFNLGSYLGAKARLKSRKLKRDDKARQLYYLDLSYSDAVDDQQQQDADQNTPPDQRKPEWAWDFETVGYVLRKDVDDSSIAVANSAGEPFELETEIAIPILTIERWEAYFDPSNIINYINHRNENVFWTAPANAVVCTGIRDRKDTNEITSGIAYRKVTYNFKFMVPFIADVMEGAKEIVADIGTRYKLTSGATTYTEYRSTGGMPTKCSLNTDGTLRTAAQTLLFKKFNKFPKADFNDLNINNTQI